MSLELSYNPSRCLWDFERCVICSSPVETKSTTEFTENAEFCSSEDREL